MADFLNDKTFLQKVNHYKVRIYKAAITVLDFMTEQPLARLEGKVVSGNLQVAANSSLRRTGSLTVVFDDDTKEITNINNLISINKKISLSIGFQNPYYEVGEYRQYGEYLWFKQGVFFITAASATRSATSAQVSVTIQDKMAGLNGTCGGVIPATTSFHDRIIFDAKGDYTTEYPLIKQIIREVVHHFGGEHFSRISIEDVPEVGRQVVRWSGSKPVYFQKPEFQEGSSGEAGEQISLTTPKGYGKEDNNNGWEMFSTNEKVGYMETDLTYPGELIQKGGTAVTAILDTIVKALGNYEYFYDVEGIFHFRQIKNYQATGTTPLNYSVDLSYTSKIGQDGKPTNEMRFEGLTDNDKELWSLYLKSYGDTAFINEFADSSLITQVSYNPKYDNIKNDFVVWGTKNANGNDTAGMVRYHLAIDERPKNIVKPIAYDTSLNWTSVCKENKADRNYDPGSSGVNSIVGNNYSLCHKEIFLIKDAKTGIALRYQTSSDINSGEKRESFVKSLDEIFKDCVDQVPEDFSQDSELLQAEREAQRQKYFFNWREELYRQALIAYGTSVEGSYYDEELMAEWRKIFDPTSTSAKKGSTSFESRWYDYFGGKKNSPKWYGFNIDVIAAPEKLSYWLDIIDSSAPIGQFGVNRIGRRSKVTENSQIENVFEGEVPDRVFVLNPGDPQKMREIMDSYNSIGQTYCFISSNMKDNFMKMNSFGTCYEDVRDLLYTHLMYNASVSITSIPLFYLDVNRIVHLNFRDMGIVGDYVINQMSWQIGSNNTMTLSVTEAKVVV